MEDTLLIVIATGLFNLLIKLVQILWDRRKSDSEKELRESERGNKDAETISSLYDSISQANENYKSLYKEYSLISEQLKEIKKSSEDKDEKIKELESKVDEMADKNIQKDKRIAHLEETINELKKENESLKKMGFCIGIENCAKKPEENNRK